MTAWPWCQGSAWTPRPPSESPSVCPPSGWTGQTRWVLSPAPASTQLHLPGRGFLLLALTSSQVWSRDSIGRILVWIFVWSQWGAQLNRPKSGGDEQCSVWKQETLVSCSRRAFLPVQSGCLARYGNIWTNAREWFWKHPIKNLPQYLECEAVLDFQKILFYMYTQNTRWLISLCGQNPLCKKMLSVLFTAIIIILTDLFLITW